MVSSVIVLTRAAPLLLPQRHHGAVIILVSYRYGAAWAP